MSFRICDLGLNPEVGNTGERDGGGRFTSLRQGQFEALRTPG